MPTDFLHPGEVDLGEPEARCLAAHVEHDLAPRVDYEAVTVRPPAVGVLADLRGGDHPNSAGNRMS